MSPLDRARGKNMNAIRRWLAHTPLSTAARYTRAVIQSRQWTEHDQAMFDFYSQFVAPGQLFFDVGANDGNRTKIGLKLGARVVAVEPQDACVRVMRLCYANRKNLTLVHQALGATDGCAEMMISNVSTLSTLSPDWMTSVKTSGRFNNFQWIRKQSVRLTTLDALIGRFGTPAFIKIDVEGYEYEVIKGLTQPVNAMSFEFTPEHIAPSLLCIKHLQQLGAIEANYSVGEFMELILPEWISASEMIDMLSEYAARNRQFGDVYIRFLT